MYKLIAICSVLAVVSGSHLTAPAVSSYSYRTLEQPHYNYAVAAPAISYAAAAPAISYRTENYAVPAIHTAPAITYRTAPALHSIGIGAVSSSSVHRSDVHVSQPTYKLSTSYTPAIPAVAPLAYRAEVAPALHTSVIGSGLGYAAAPVSVGYRSESYVPTVQSGVVGSHLGYTAPVASVGLEYTPALRTSYISKPLEIATAPLTVGYRTETFPALQSNYIGSGLGYASGHVAATLPIARSHYSIGYEHAPISHIPKTYKAYGL